MYLFRIHVYSNDFIFKQTNKKKTTTKNNNKKTGKNITEQHKHSLKREVGLLRRLTISPLGLWE